MLSGARPVYGFGGEGHDRNEDEIRRAWVASAAAYRTHTWTFSASSSSMPTAGLALPRAFAALSFADGAPKLIGLCVPEIFFENS